MSVKRQKRSKIRSGHVARCGDANGKANCEKKKLWLTNYSFEMIPIKIKRIFVHDLSKETASFD